MAGPALTPTPGTGPVGPYGVDTNTDYTSPDQAAASLLEALGWTLADGETPGSQAVWTKPGATPNSPELRDTQKNLTDKALGADSPYTPAKPPAGNAASSDIYYDAQGKAYRWNGTRDVPAPQFDNPTKAAGYKAPTAGAAPRDLRATEYENAAIQEQIRQHDQQVTQWGVEASQKAQDAKFLATKEAWAERDGDAKLLQATQAQRDQVESQRATLNFQIAQSQQKSAELQQQLRSQTEQFNATQGLATQKANNEAAASRETRLNQVNTDIGVLGQDTGNRGRFASFATAASPFGAQNTALGTGTSLIDDTSVQPLETALGTRQSIQNENPSPYTFTPLALPPLSNMAQGPLSAGTNTPVDPRVVLAQRGLDPWTGAAPTSATSAPAAAQPAPQGAMSAPGTNAQTQQAALLKAFADAGVTPPSGFNTSFGGAQEHGGMVRGAFMAGDSSDGDENPEVVIPLTDGSGGTFVVSLKGMPKDKIKSAKSRLQKFATGGLFDNLSSSPLSKSFLTEASKKARAGTPWETGQLPSPVFASSPGFDPDVADLIDSIRALEQGVPSSYSRRLTAQARPTALSGPRTISRSA